MPFYWPIQIAELRALDLNYNNIFTYTCPSTAIRNSEGITSNVTK